MQTFFQSSHPKLNYEGLGGKILPLPTDEGEFHQQLLHRLQDDQTWYFSSDGQRSKKVALDFTSDSEFYLKFYFENDLTAISLSILGGCHKVTSPSGHEYGEEVPNSIILDYPLGESNIPKDILLFA